MRKLSFLFVFSFILILSNTSHAALIFEETFFKDIKGAIEIDRNIPASAGAAIVVFSNGGIENPQAADMVGGGFIEINGDKIFGALDFDILGPITKKIPFIDGINTLSLTMKGKKGGRLTIQVFQGEDQPPVTFPPGTIFVSPLGTDTSSCGLKSFAPVDSSDTSGPCLTIGFGSNRAEQIGGVQVVVGSGIYIENITLRNGISLMGGYDPEFSKRDIVSLRAIIKGDGSLPATISAISITANTLFEGFIVEGPSAAADTPFGNSIGLYVKDSTGGLVVRNNIVFAGVGSNGARGANGVHGQNGNVGGNGNGGLVYTGSFSGTIPGGSGGTSPTAHQGGLGGDSNAPVGGIRQSSGQSGFGSGAGGGGGGGGGYNYSWESSCDLINTYGYPWSGDNGANGGPGVYGSGGAGGNLGNVLSNIWVSQPGGFGLNGGTGGGGGGGGAAGGVARNNCSNGLVGSSGGGGGAGGEFGNGGEGGEGGGSAFGIFVYASDSSQIPDISSNKIYLGIAGNGGDGGFGGKGGVGGQGGLGGNILYRALISRGGSGGRGGDGGHGGGGGGGAGGISVGIFANFLGQYGNINAIVISTGRSGLGGSGGLSLGNPGWNGSDGQVLPTYYYQ